MISRTFANWNHRSRWGHEGKLFGKQIHRVSAARNASSPSTRWRKLTAIISRRGSEWALKWLPLSGTASEKTTPTEVETQGDARSANGKVRLDDWANPTARIYTRPEGVYGMDRSHTRCGPYWLNVQENRTWHLGRAVDRKVHGWKCVRYYWKKKQTLDTATEHKNVIYDVK